MAFEPDTQIIGGEYMSISLDDLRTQIYFNTYMLATGTLLRGIAIHLVDRVRYLEQENEELRASLGARRRLARSRDGKG